MTNDSETVRDVCANCEVFDAYERFKAAKDAEIARLKAALKPVMECKIVRRDEENYLVPEYIFDAVREAQRIMKEGESK